MDVILTAAITVNGMIAHHSEETIRWSEDLHLFRKQTMGHTVVMGSNTEKTLATELDGREVIVMHRDMDPSGVLGAVKTGKCFIIGGSRTYSRFASHLTHLYLTIHPLIFSSDSLPLFSQLDNDMRMEFERMVKVSSGREFYQFQYRVLATET